MNHSMSMTADHIRLALIQIAQRMGRPPFDMVVVRDVINAFRFDRDHHLKTAVHEEKIVIQRKPSAFELRYEKFKSVVSQHGMTIALGKASGLDPLFINKISSGERDVDEATWSMLEKGMQLLEQDLSQYTKSYKYDECGTYARYKNRHCRCDACIAANKAYKPPSRAA